MKKAKNFFMFCTLIALVLGFAGTVLAVDMGKVNINKASAEELTTLAKIGPKIAANIVEYRKANGLFSRPEDLMNVKGIGAKIFEMNKERIIVSDMSSKAEKPEKEPEKKTAPVPDKKTDTSTKTPEPDKKTKP